MFSQFSVMSWGCGCGCYLFGGKMRDDFLLWNQGFDRTGLSEKH